MTNAKSYCMVITRTICTVAHDLVLWIRISCHLLVRNHINVVYVTSVLKKIIDVNRYLRRHTWDKPYQSSNCDIIFKICIHKWYVKISVGDWDSLYMKHLKMYNREKHISATIIIWPYVKLHISIFLFNEEHYWRILSLTAGKLQKYIIYKKINMNRICWVIIEWIFAKLHKCVFCTIIQSYRYEGSLRNIRFCLMEKNMYLVYTSTRYCPFKYKKMN